MANKKDTKKRKYTKKVNKKVNNDTLTLMLFGLGIVMTLLICELVYYALI